PKPAGPVTDADRLYREYRRMLAGLARRGIRKKASQTPSEFAASAPWDEVRTVTRAFEATRYGDVAVTPEEVAKVQQQVEAVLEKAAPR
ncbi:MAG: DUF4129 domain-containing protein, partial [Candidatus Xenobia bacterium]